MSISYPYLPQGRTVIYVNGDNPFMKVAKEVCREHSTDRQHPTGAVLVRNDEILLKAANQSAIKNPTLLNLHKKGLCVRQILKIPSGQKYWLCLGCGSSKNHAETLVVTEAARKNIDTAGADLYLWGHWWCCEPCWNAMISAGIRGVYLLEGSERLFNRNYPDNIIGRQFEVWQGIATVIYYYKVRIFAKKIQRHQYVNEKQR